MRILLHSRFYPNVGGIETVASLLAHEWHRTGESVNVVSDIAGTPEQSREFPFPVHYRPNPMEWLRLLRWSDVFVHMNISLKSLWPSFIVRRPFVAVHHSFYYINRNGDRDWRERLKLQLSRLGHNIAVSEAVAERLPNPCIVIGNPVDIRLFNNSDNVPRDRDLVFVGRLVSDKGCDLLIKALEILRGSGLQPKLTVIGNGPERSVLERLAASCELSDQINFVGAQPPAQVAKLLRYHKVLVLPSLVEETFGMVALEGAASGCVILGSDGGGLPEAIGPCGITFRRGDISDLAGRLAHLLTHPELFDRYRAAAAAHLGLHHPTRVAQRYLEVFERTLSGSQLATRSAHHA